MYGSLKNFVVLLAAVTATQFSISAPASIPQQCIVKDRSNTVVVMVCQPNLSQSVWQKAGEAVCEAGQMCNVWIWDDPKKAPLNAPVTDAEFPKTHAASAVAIWVNDARSVITVKKKNKSK
jgi:hypothetical protein